jgi:hypothetical protein
MRERTGLMPSTYSGCGILIVTSQVSFLISNGIYCRWIIGHLLDAGGIPRTSLERRKKLLKLDSMKAESLGKKMGHVGLVASHRKWEISMFARNNSASLIQSGYRKTKIHRNHSKSKSSSYRRHSPPREYLIRIFHDIPFDLARIHPSYKVLQISTVNQVKRMIPWHKICGISNHLRTNSDMPLFNKLDPSTHICIYNCLVRHQRTG